ncbi:hypothetical protein [Candidatus Manganitrophus noduliformans]|uniref:Uncharacterized protein n=1 Tax=Candidatus Manganitrophus noduliformans TaxID=2606439 RepID=A0A7X6DSC9_9BACT|nr:hypothetical protein [Candidatus Manganitrophus noduliformans]NKE72274.1 hypothetical protein [Candidatus Manganitrophus noduliformans]
MFEGARLKIERGNQHIVDLRSTINAFLQRHPYTLSVRHNPNGNEITIEMNLREQAPSAIPLILGDSIHNLRTALDHATWELIGLDGGTQDRYTTFPTGAELPGYKGTCNGIKTPRSDTKEFLASFEAYKGGKGEILYALHCLDVEDKHIILTPTVNVSSIRRMTVIRPDGIVALTVTNQMCGMDKIGRSRIMTLGIVPGSTIEFNPDTDSTVDIFFGDIEFFKFQPIIPTIVQISNAVSHAIGQFDNFVKTRS